MGEATGDVADDDAEGWFSGDPFRLVKGTGTERFRRAVDTVRNQQLDVVGQAREAMSAKGIDLDRHLAEFVEACRLPGVHAELVEAPEMSELHGGGRYLVMGPAIRFSSHALGQRQVALGIVSKQFEVEFVLLDACATANGRWDAEYPFQIHNLDHYFEKLAFIAGEFQAKTLVANAERLETADEREPDTDIAGELASHATDAAVRARGWLRRLFPG